MKVGTIHIVPTFLLESSALFSTADEKNSSAKRPGIRSRFAANRRLLGTVHFEREVVLSAAVAEIPRGAYNQQSIFTSQAKVCLAGGMSPWPLTGIEGNT
jgi:hypothetical protein